MTALISTNTLDFFTPDFDVIPFSPLLSDVHCPIHLTLKTKTSSSQISHRTSYNNLETPTHYTYDNRKRPGHWVDDRKDIFQNNIDTFKIELLKQQLHDMKAQQNSGHMQTLIDNATDTLKHILTDAAYKTNGSRKINPSKITHDTRTDEKTYEKWFSQDCHDARAEYNKARKQYNKTKCNEKYNALRNASRKYKQTLNSALQKHRKTISDDLKRSRFDNPREFWKKINANNKKQSNIKADPNILFEHFRASCAADNSPSPNRASEINIEPSESNETLNGEITENEVLSAVDKLKTNKAPGDDMIINEYIKNSSTALLPIITCLFNIILSTGIYPTEWSLGSITPIFKNKGNELDPQNYRPITLISCVGKLFSVVLNERLKLFLEENDVVDENQGAFISDSSTTTHLFALHCLVELSKHQKQPLYCAFIDLKAAYDNVWRQGLFEKLAKTKINGKFFEVIQSMYSKTKAFIRCNGLSSKHFVCSSGIRQGCSLSCLLFVIFLNDLEKTLEDTKCKGFNVKGETTETAVLLKLFSLLYADDTVLLHLNATFRPLLRVSATTVNVGN